MEWALLGSLPPEQRRQLLSLARRRRFARNEVVFHEGDPGDSMHLLERGRVAIRVATPLGEHATLRVLGPGSFFGEMALVSPAPRNATVVALEAVETLSLHRDHLDELRGRSPAVDRVMLDAVVAEVRRLSHQLLEALYVPVEQRVLRRLLELTELYGAGEPTVTIPLTQEDLAELAGTTRPTANKVLKEAEAQGVVEIARGRITVVDAELLEKRSR